MNLDSNWGKPRIWHARALLVVLLLVVAFTTATSVGCSKYDLYDIASSPDAREILRRHYEVIKQNSSIGSYYIVRVFGEMSIEPGVGSVEIASASTGQYRYFWRPADQSPEVLKRYYGKDPPRGFALGGWDGTTEWSTFNGSFETALPRKSFPEQSFILLGLQIQLLTENREVRLVEIVSWKDTSAYVLEVRDDVVSIRIYIDTDSYLVLSTESKSDAGIVYIDYFDWKLLDREFMPTRLSGMTYGKAITLSIDRVEHDPPYVKVDSSPPTGRF